MFEFDPRFRHYNSGFALTRGSGVLGTWVPAGTHRISENLGTDGYQVPARRKKLGTDGYRVPARKKILGTDGYRVPGKFSLMPTPGPLNKKKINLHLDKVEILGQVGFQFFK